MKLKYYTGACGRAFICSTRGAVRAQRAVLVLLALLARSSTTCFFWAGVGRARFARPSRRSAIGPVDGVQQGGLAPLND